MSTFIITFVFFLIVTVAMAVGYIFQQKSIAGSCGGLGALGIDKACDCPEPCDKRRRRMAKEEQAREQVKAQGRAQGRAQKEASWKENRIL